jgi:4-hydroxy-3-polyprenylbenzoate decarboxylase
MAFRNLQDFIQQLEKAGELIRIKEFVDPRFEIAEVTDRVIKSRGKALLFENTGTAFPVLMNAMGSYRRMCMVLGVNELDDVGDRIEAMFKDLSSPRLGFWEKLKVLPTLGMVAGWMPGHKSGRGECQAVVMADPDLSKLPVLTSWPHDGGPFVTFPVVSTRSPENGIRNVGMYRMQVFGKTTTGMHWHLHKGSARHYEEYKARAEIMPVVVTLGGDPAYTYAATAPLPENVDEFFFAGFLRKKKVEMVKCLTCDLEVPSDVDFVIEGYVDPREEKLFEGPFGDHTGYYSLPDYYPAFHVTCITHRADAVYPATVVGIPPQEDLWIGKATERIFLKPIRLTMLPEVRDLDMPAEGVAHNLVLTQIRQEFPGQAGRVMSSLWGAGQMMFNKIMVVVDEATPLTDYRAVAKTVLANFDPAEDILISKGPLDVLDHAGIRFAYGGKLGFDGCTKKAGEQKIFPAISIRAEAIRAELNQVVLNDGLAQSGLAVLILAIRKDEKGAVAKATDYLLRNKLIAGIKLLVFVEDTMDPTDVSNVVWKVCNNIDPLRDCKILPYPGEDCALLMVDGTRKTPELDGVTRPWPNIIVSDEETVRKVDEKWARLGLGDFIPSPSEKYRKQVYSDSAFANE